MDLQGENCGTVDGIAVSHLTVLGFLTCENHATGVNESVNVWAWCPTMAFYLGLYIPVFEPRCAIGSATIQNKTVTGGE